MPPAGIIIIVIIVFLLRSSPVIMSIVASVAFPTTNTLVEKLEHQGLLGQVLDAIVNSGALEYATADNKNLTLGWGLLQNVLNNPSTGLLRKFKSHGRITGGDKVATRMKTWVENLLTKCKKGSDRLGDGAPDNVKRGATMFVVLDTAKKALASAQEEKKKKKLEEQKAMESVEKALGLQPKQQKKNQSKLTRNVSPDVIGSEENPLDIENQIHIKEMATNPLNKIRGEQLKNHQQHSIIGGTMGLMKEFQGTLSSIMGSGSGSHPSSSSSSFRPIVEDEKESKVESKVASLDRNIKRLREMEEKEDDEDRKKKFQKKRHGLEEEMLDLM